MSIRPNLVKRVTRSSARRVLLGVVLALSGGASGCAWEKWHLLPRAPVPPAPAESLVLRGDSLEAETAPTDNKAFADLAGAHELYRRGEYAKAEKVFHRVADDTKNSPVIAEESRYYEAECLRRQEHYPKAADTYNKMLMDFPGGMHREQAIQHIYEIANYWLDDTRKEMRAAREKKDGKRWFIMPCSFVHFEKSKPFLDEEGRAVEKLEQVNLNNIHGPLADQSLFLLGSLRFYREDYREADYYFSQLVDVHPNSKYASKAVELAIISKHMSTGGSDYDGRKVAEARELVCKARNSYPELARAKGAFLDRQLCGITLQQAEKDYKIAEFYRRTGHPGSAYFYYEIVRRRYPGTEYCAKATERKQQLDKDRQAAKAHWFKQPEAEPARPPQDQGQPETAPLPQKLPALPAQELGQPELAPPPQKLPPRQPAPR